MYRDLRDSPSLRDVGADVCIVGAGAAGITLAHALRRSKLEICLVESGGFRPDPAVQALYSTESAGIPYDTVGTRLRYFGGSTNVGGWGGWCKPLDPIDFRHRDWVPGSGWPFGRDELEKYYRRANEICDVGPYDYDIASWRSQLGERLDPLPLDGPRVETQLAQLGPPTHFGHKFRAELGAATNVTVLINANVTEIVVSPDMSEGRGVKIATLNGAACQVHARTVVLAAGGIENARLLLLSGGTNGPGLGNEHDLVGRNFCDHPRIDVGTLELNERGRLLNLYDGQYKVRQRKQSTGAAYDESLVAGSVSLTPSFQEEAGLLNYRTWIIPRWDGGDSAAVAALKRLHTSASERIIRIKPASHDALSVLRHPRPVATWAYGRTRRPPRLVRGFDLVNILEPQPLGESRVTLSDQLDPLGMRRARLDWRVGRLVRKTLAHAHKALDDDLRSSGTGRIVDPFQEDDVERFNANLGWVWHHMGTTRMDSDSAQGVVDPTCRLHGMSNVYVAGSSVFPTAGNDMPTLTIVALALRLADHLNSVLSPSHEITAPVHPGPG